MPNRAPSLLSRGLAMVGVLFVGGGLYLPWVRVNPTHEGPVISIWLVGMETGLTTMDAIALIPAFVVLFSLPRNRGCRTSGLAAVCCGAFYAALPVIHMIVVLMPPFVSASGAFVTGVGGVLVVVAGGTLLLTTVQVDWLRTTSG